MSGGRFGYLRFKIEDVIEELEDIIGFEKEPEPVSEWDYATYKRRFCEKTIKHFKDAVKTLRKAAIYEHRIDWLLCGDDNEEEFLENIEEELKEIEGKQ